jgi:hypothetical protein
VRRFNLLPKKQVSLMTLDRNKINAKGYFITSASFVKHEILFFLFFQNMSFRPKFYGQKTSMEQRVLYHASWALFNTRMIHHRITWSASMPPRTR